MKVHLDLFIEEFENALGWIAGVAFAIGSAAALVYWTLQLFS